MLIRPGQAGDLEQINDVYNHYVRETAITFDIELITMAERTEWFGHYDVVGRHRLLVAVSNDRVLGYATSSPWHPRRAYETSIETSIYLASDATGRDIGSALYSRLFSELDGQDLHCAYGGVTMPNPASIALHERFGFERVAYFTEQGRKFGCYWDVALYEKPLG
ncbi:MAG TPA: GNAT family N-acetyltransferase [Acidimicrobiia bacterium]|nr:GNAT family N-acetyltransferase [Acidimicrobiia bacterium]